MTDRVPELPALRLLVAVARTGSIGAAAREVGVTQQSASERLRAVEAQVGVPLVRRGSRGTVLTDAGTVVVEWASRLLALADEVDHAIDGLRAEGGRGLAVWASMTVAEGLLPRWLVLLRQRQEAADRAAPVGRGSGVTSISLRAANTEQVLEAVRDGRAGLGFVEGSRVPAGLRSTVVAADELVLVATSGSPLTRRRRPLAPDEVATLALTGREQGSGTREVVESALAAHGLSAPPPVVELTTAVAVRESVLAGSAPAFLSRRMVARELQAGQLVEVRTPALDLRRDLRAVWSGGREPPAGAARDLVGIARTTGE